MSITKNLLKGNNTDKYRMVGVPLCTEVSFRLKKLTEQYLSIEDGVILSSLLQDGLSISNSADTPVFPELPIGSTVFAFPLSVDVDKQVQKFMIENDLKVFDVFQHLIIFALDFLELELVDE